MKGSVKGFYLWGVITCMEYANFATFWDAVFAQKKAVNPENLLPSGIT
jgi:hypothetical protein